jgi:hypothetical protein
MLGGGYWSRGRSNTVDWNESRGRNGVEEITGQMGPAMVIAPLDPAPWSSFPSICTPARRLSVVRRNVQRHPRRLEIAVVRCEVMSSEWSMWLCKEVGRG